MPNPFGGLNVDLGFVLTVAGLVVSVWGLVLALPATAARIKRKKEHTSTAWKTAQALLTKSLYGQLGQATAVAFSSAILERLLNINGRRVAELVTHTRWFIELTFLRRSAEPDKHIEPISWLKQTRRQHLTSHEATFTCVARGVPNGNITFSVATRFVLTELMQQEPSVERYFKALAAAREGARGRAPRGARIHRSFSYACQDRQRLSRSSVPIDEFARGVQR